MLHASTGSSFSFLPKHNKSPNLLALTSEQLYSSQHQTVGWKSVLPITHSLKKKPRILETFLDLVSPGSCWGWLSGSPLMWTVSQENTARDLACLKCIVWCLAWLIFDIKFPFSSLGCRNGSFMVLVVSCF